MNKDLKDESKSYLKIAKRSDKKIHKGTNGLFVNKISDKWFFIAIR